MRLINSARFRGLFWTQLLGAFNDNFFKNALLIMIVYQGLGGGHYSEDQVSLFASALFILPFFLFSATAGQLADKYNKAMLIRRIKAVEVILAASAAIGLLLGSLPFLFLALGLLGVQSSFFGPVKYGIIPQLLETEDLTEGNALVETGTKIAILTGTLTGGLIASSHHAIWGCSVVMLLVAIFGFLTAKAVVDVAPADPDIKVEINPIAPTFRVLQMARQTRSVFLSILGISWFWSLGVGLLSLLPVYGKQILSVDGTVVTIFLGMFSIGVAIGAVLCGKFSYQRLEIGLVPFGSLGISLFLFDLAYIGSPFTVTGETLLTIQEIIREPVGLRILFDLMAISVCSGLYIVPLYTLIQQRTPEQFRSRVVAANNVLNACFMVVSLIFLAGLGHFGFTVIGMFVALSALNLMVGLYIYTLIPEFFLRFLAYLINHVIYRLKVVNEERIPKEGAVLLVGNHVSFLDWLVMLGAVHRPIRFVMWHSYYYMPLFRYLFRDAGAIPIASGKSHPEILQEAFDRIDQALEDGQVVCIFPEGQLTVDGEVGEFRKGVERILERRPVPFLTFALSGLWDSLFSRQPNRTLGSKFKRFFRPKVGVQFGTLQPPPSEDRIHGLAGQLKQQVVALRGPER